MPGCCFCFGHSAPPLSSDYPPLLLQSSWLDEVPAESTELRLPIRFEDCLYLFGIERNELLASPCRLGDIVSNMAAVGLYA